MMIQYHLTSYHKRHLLSSSMAVLIAAFVDGYYFHQAGWVILAAFLVVHVTRGTPFRQGLIFTVTMIAALLLASSMLVIMSPVMVVLSVALIFFISAYVIFLSQPLSNIVLYRAMLFPFVFIVAMLLPPSSFPTLRMHLIEVITGMGIGMGCNQLIFPGRFSSDFQKDLVPVLRASLDYLQAVTVFFLRRDIERERLREKKIALEKSLQAQEGSYPEWVYEAGFNPGLRASFRFYLVSVERMVELLCSMEYLALYGIEDDTLEQVSDAIAMVMQKNAALLQVLIAYFQGHPQTVHADDFTSDMVALEEIVSRMVPRHLALLDVVPDHVTLMAFVRDMKDLRRLLLQLVAGLPADVQKNHLAKTHADG